MKTKVFFKGDVVDVAEGHVHKILRQGRVQHQHQESPQYWFVQFDDEHGQSGKYVSHNRIKISANPHID